MSEQTGEGGQAREAGKDREAGKAREASATAARLLVRTLEAEGVEYVFGIPGGDTT